MLNIAKISDFSLSIQAVYNLCIYPVFIDNLCHEKNMQILFIDNLINILVLANFAHFSKWFANRLTKKLYVKVGDFFHTTINRAHKYTSLREEERKFRKLQKLLGN